MIHVTRINHTQLVLNSELIEHLESTPDTVISLSNGQKLVVLESAEEIVQRVIAFRRKVCGLPYLSGGAERKAGVRAEDL